MLIIPSHPIIRHAIDLDIIDPVDGSGIIDMMMSAETGNYLLLPGFELR